MNRKFDVDEKKATHLYCSHDITKNMSEFLEEVWNSRASWYSQ